MIPDITFQDREFDQAITELAGSSSRIDIDVLTGQAIQFIRVLVKNTPVGLEKRGKRTRFRNRGRARAGWWPAWRRLGAFSRPRGASSRVLSLNEGGFRDGRQRAGQPFFEMINEVNYIDKLEKSHDILGNSAVERAADMQQELTRRYQREMQRKSG